MSRRDRIGFMWMLVAALVLGMGIAAEIGVSLFFIGAASISSIVGVIILSD
jgi:hypothetical protein